MGAARAFRLTRIEVGDLDEVDEFLDVSFGARQSDASWTTLITGRNGSGKSRLLAAAATAFDAMNGREFRKAQSITIEYHLGDQECAFQVDGKRRSAYLDGRPVELERLPRPRSVVAATASAFDKFHLPRESKSLDPKPTDSLYRYLGLKDARGRVSSRAGVFRALEQLFDASAEDHQRRQRVADVFTYLGYSPNVEVTYAWTVSGRQTLEAASEDPTVAIQDYLLDAAKRDDNATRSFLPNYLYEDPMAVGSLSDSFQAIRDFSDGNRVRLNADFEHPNSRPEHLLRMARLLSRVGFLQMEDVHLRRMGSKRGVRITDASSGELSLAITMLGIASSIQDQSLILIDEPEISLHPQWQSEYLERLTQGFAAYRGCHFVIATHSPTIVAGASSEAISIVDLEEQSPLTDEPTGGRSVDEVLFETFGVISSNNLHLRDLLVTALRGAEDGNLATSSFDRDMQTLEIARRELPVNDPTGRIIDSLVRLRSQLAERTPS